MYLGHSVVCSDKCTTTNTAYLFDVTAATCFGLICTNPLSYQPRSHKDSDWQ